MAEQSLIDYIKAHINTYSQEQIRQGLVQSGWDQGSIDAAFREVLSEPPPGPGPAPPTAGTGGMLPPGKPQLVLKPRIIAGIFPRFFATLVVLIFLSLIFNPLAFLVLLGIDPMISLILAFSLVIFLSIFFPYMNLRAREYRFFSDRAEFYEGFLNIQRKVVRYDRVTDISYNRSVWERLWGTGTVLLNTAGSPYKEIRIAYVRDSERVYHNVQNLVKGSVHSRTGTESYGAYSPQ
jgi:membrane protein YdbS with pleckstrin-like domain